MDRFGVPGLLGGVAFGRFLYYMDQDAAREQIAAEGRAVAAVAEARMRRAETLTLLGAGEVFPAGVVVLADAHSGLRPRPAIVAVTVNDLVLLDADPEIDEGVLGRIPRGEITDVRLFDRTGERPKPMTEVEELDAPRANYVVWLDGDEGRGHPFVFPSYNAAAEAERDFRRQLTSGNRPSAQELPPTR
jgi:hypothetical protein